MMSYPGQNPDSYNTYPAGHGDKPPDPLTEIRRFIAITDDVTKQQLYYLALARPMHTPEEHEKLDNQITTDIEQNVTALELVIPALGKMGMQLSITDPQTNRNLPLAGIGYSTDNVGYRAGVYIDREPVMLPLDPEHLDARSVF